MVAKGPSIGKPELQRLFGEARTMQAILGVFRFFYERMALIKKQFARCDLIMPPRIHFEVLGRLLMAILYERYPTTEKILKLSVLLGITEEIAAQLIVFPYYLESLRHISPKLFRSSRHRKELSMSLTELLSDLEDEMEEEEEEKKKKKKKHAPPSQKDTIE